MVGTPLMTGHRVAHIARSRPSLRSDFGRGNKVNHHDLLLTCEVGTHLCLFNAGLAWALAFFTKKYRTRPKTNPPSRRRRGLGVGHTTVEPPNRESASGVATTHHTAPPPLLCVHPEPAPPSRSPRTPAGQVGCGLRTPRRVALVQGLSNLPLTSQSVSLSRAPPAPTVSPPHSRAARARGAGPGRGGRHQKSHFSHYIKCTVI